MSKVYVASSWREERYPEVVEALRKAGHDVYDFRNPPDATGFSWSNIDSNWIDWPPSDFRDALKHPIADRGFASDMNALKWCEACVHVVPSTAGRSSHLELGWAAGAGKLTIILLGQGEPELMYKMADRICLTVDEVITALDEDGARKLTRAYVCPDCAETFENCECEPRWDPWAVGKTKGER